MSTRYRMKHVTKCLLFFLIVSGVGVDIAVEANESCHGGIEVIKVLGDFSVKGRGEWEVRIARNLKITSAFGYTPDGSNFSTLRLDIELKDVTGDKNWFGIRRKVDADASWREAEGIRISLAVDEKEERWFSLTLRTGNNSVFNYVPVLPRLFSSEFQDRLLRFKDFKAETKTDISLDPAEIVEITLNGHGAGVVYLNEISLYRPAKCTGWLRFETNSKCSNNIFELNEPISLKFILENGFPRDKTGVAYEINDYYNKIVRSNSFSLSVNKKEYSIEFTAIPPGFYEVRVFGLNSEGERDVCSCIKATGSMPAGLGTFAVMPSTVRENIQSMLEVGQDAFFGIHGGRRMFQLNELMGMPWMLIGQGWRWLEPKKPNRASGIAPWLRDKFYHGGPLPPYLFAVCSPFKISHFGLIPEWARDSEKEAPGFKWDEFLNWVRDFVKYNKFLCPHMNPRMYEPVWEINHNTPVWGRKPLFNSEDVVEAVKRAGEVIKSEDPNAIILAPTANFFYTKEWYESLFKAGLLDYIDAVSTHLYVSPLENSRIPEQFAELEAMIRKYGKKSFQIYNTETGFTSGIGSTQRLREHAQWNVRYALILKGEGLRMHLSFYPFDFDPSLGSSYGLCFNLDPKVKFQTVSLAPKAAVPALAVCANQLLGAKPVSNVRAWGKNIWGYVFERKGEPVLVLWQPYKQARLLVPVGDVDAVDVVDIMGHRSKKNVIKGMVDLEIGPDPQYIWGISKEIYLPEVPASELNLPKFYAGQQKDVPVLEKERFYIKSVKTWGGIRAECRQNSIQLSVPDGASYMPLPLSIQYKDGQGRMRQTVKWVIIGDPVDFEDSKMVVENEMFGVQAIVRNFTSRIVPVRLALRTNQNRNWKEAAAGIPKQTRKSFFFPVQKVSGEIADSKEPLDIELKLQTDNGAEINRTEKVYLLSAYPREDRTENRVFPNHVQVQGEGSSGRKDTSDVWFAWDDNNLYIKIAVQDDVFHQSICDGYVWREDGIQLAFDTDPDSEYLYNPLAGLYSKKVTEIAIARTPKGNMIWRHITHNPNELPLGDVTNSGINVNIMRDEKNRTTTYECGIPWKQIGRATVEKEQQIGISILVNDSDGAETKRKWIEFFSGIATSKNYRLFGRLTLR